MAEAASTGPGKGTTITMASQTRGDGAGQKRSRMAIAWAAFIVISVALAATEIRTFDLGYHLATGKRVWSEGQIPQTDRFSYTSDGSEWPLHQAVPALSFFLIHRAIGFQGLWLFKIALVVLIFSIVFRTAARNLQGTLGQGELLIIMVLVMAACRLRFMIRPFLFSALCLAVVSAVLYLPRRGRTPIKCEVAIALTFAVWINLHAGWISGLILIGMHQVGLIMDRFRGTTGLLDLGDARRWAAVALGLLMGGGVAYACGNEGLAAIQLPLSFFSDPLFKNTISEFRPVDWTDLSVIGPLVAVLVVWAIGWYDQRWAALLPGIAFAVLALSTQRLLLDWAIVACVPAIPGIRILADRRARLIRGKSARYWNLLPHLLAFLVVGAILTLVKEPDFGYALPHQFYPRNAFAFIRSQDPKGRVFNEDAWGGYFAWEFWPERQVFIDNRLPVYGATFFRDEYSPIIRARDGWQKRLDQWGVTTLLLLNQPRQVPLVEAAYASETWELVYWDDVAVIFLNRRRLGDSVTRLAYRRLNPLEPQESLSRAYGPDLAAELLRAIDDAPGSNALALNLMGVVLARREHTRAALDLFRRALEVAPELAGAQKNLETALRTLEAGQSVDGPADR